jgi:hypothetical protein
VIKLLLKDIESIEGNQDKRAKNLYSDINNDQFTTPSEFVNDRKKSVSYADATAAKQIPVIVNNRYEVLSNLKEVEIKRLTKDKKPQNSSKYFEKRKGEPEAKVIKKNKQDDQVKECRKNFRQQVDYRKSSEQTIPQKVVIIGDSHARGYATNMKHSLKNHMVIGYVKPGASIDTLITTAKKDIEYLNKNDTIVFLGGTKDVSRNNTQNGLRQLVDFVKSNKHTNILLVRIPYRYDLAIWSCVNKEVESYNRKLVKTMKPYEHVKVINVETKREHFTRHGLHMNKEGKEQTARKTADAINTMFQKQIEEPIRLQWITKHIERINPNLCGENRIEQDKTKLAATENEGIIAYDEYQKMSVEEISTVTKESEQTIRTSSRQNKANIMRSKDFLWQKESQTSKNM